MSGRADGPVWMLENRWLSAAVSSTGARLCSLVDRSTGRDWLWTAPQTEAHSTDGDCFDDRWSGGMDVIFPTDEPDAARGAAYRDHGVFWGSDWQCERQEPDTLLLGCTQGSLRLTMHYALRDQRLFARAEISNHGEVGLPYLFRWHPAFSLARPFRLEMQAGLAIPDRSFNEPPCALTAYSWPRMPVDRGQTIDLSHTANWREGQLLFQYVALRDGVVTLTDEASGSALRLQFDPLTLPWLTMFASVGGWRGHRVLALEPCTAPFTHPIDADGAGFGRALAPGESAAFELTMEAI